MITKPHKGLNKMQQPHVFESFFGPQMMSEPQIVPDDIKFNDNVLEISNNWDDALSFYEKLKTGTISQVGPMENDWYIFLSTYRIELDTFASPEEFMELVWQKPKQKDESN